MDSVKILWHRDSACSEEKWDLLIKELDIILLTSIAEQQLRKLGMPTSLKKKYKAYIKHQLSGGKVGDYDATTGAIGLSDEKIDEYDRATFLATCIHEGVHANSSHFGYLAGGGSRVGSIVGIGYARKVVGEDPIEDIRQFESINEAMTDLIAYYIFREYCREKNLPLSFPWGYRKEVQKLIGLIRSIARESNMPQSEIWKYFVEKYMNHSSASHFLDEAQDQGLRISQKTRQRFQQFV